MKPKFWTSEKLLSLTAVAISVCTLVVFLYQTNLIRKQQYMSVFPYVSIASAGGNTPNYKYLLLNNGIGPAIITSLKIRDNVGNEYPDVVDYVTATLTDKDTVGYYYSSIYTGRLLPQNEVVEVISLNDEKYESSIRLSEILSPENYTLEIEYKSIYGERWLVTNQKREPVKL